jgi:hypothetical protein
MEQKIKRRQPGTLSQGYAAGDSQGTAGAPC